MFQEKITFLLENWLALTGVIITILIAIYTLIHNFESKKEKIPLYGFISFNILSDGLKKNKNISISYKRKKIKTLEITNFLFWNGGKLTINKDDIPTGSELKIKCDNEIEIYDIELIYTNEESNNIRFKKINNEIIIKYEYLDFEQGAILKITHSERTNNSFEVFGKIKGAGNFKQYNSEKIKHKTFPEYTYQHLPKRPMPFVIMGFFMVFIGWFFLKGLAGYISPLLFIIFIIFIIKREILQRDIPDDFWRFFSYNKNYKN